MTTASTERWSRHALRMKHADSYAQGWSDAIEAMRRGIGHLQGGSEVKLSLQLMNLLDELSKRNAD